MAHFTKYIIVLLVLGAAGVAGWYFVSVRSGEFSEEGAPIAVQVKRMHLKRIVSLAGIVESEKKVELAFERGGKVGQVLAATGDKVETGRVLVTLENSDLTADLARAEADLAAERAELARLEKGPTEEDIRIADVKVENARRAVRDSQSGLLARIADAYTKVDDAVRNRLDRFIDNPRSSNPRVSLSGGDESLKLAIALGRIHVEGRLTEWFGTIAKLDSDSNLAEVTPKIYSHIDSAASLLRDATLFLNSLGASASLSQDTLDSYRADVGAGRINIESVRIALVLAEEKFNSAVSALNLAEEERAKVQAGFTKDEIDAERARVKRTEAVVLKVKSDFSKTVLRSPITGVVARLGAKKGESVIAGSAVATVIGTRYLIRVNIPEADIAKVTVGDEATITLDAYGSGEKFLASLTDIEPAEEIIQGVATYKSTLEFKEQDPRIKSGMTADIEIVTGERADVLAVPQRAIIRRGEERFIRVRNPRGEPEETKIEVGIVDSKGFVEITDGLDDGVFVFVY